MRISDWSSDVCSSDLFNIDQALDNEHAEFPGLEMDFASNARTFENFELFVNAVQVQGQLRLECQYNQDMFDTANVRHRSEESRLGKECVSTCRSRRSPQTQQKNTIYHHIIHTH